MHTGTGEILNIEELKKKPLEEQKMFVEIPKKILPILEGMNRKQRREYYKKNKHLFEKKSD